ncbi:MAG: hypothetical protein LBV73_08095 [Paraburkholderia sp.]|jgi:hypothetical protein|nr:hypothetical protein [Paraburkholderia sp.]
MAVEQFRRARDNARTRTGLRPRKRWIEAYSVKFPHQIRNSALQKRFRRDSHRFSQQFNGDGFPIHLAPPHGTSYSG